MAFAKNFYGQMIVLMRTRRTLLTGIAQGDGCAEKWVTSNRVLGGFVVHNDG